MIHMLCYAVKIGVIPSSHYTIERSLVTCGNSHREWDTETGCVMLQNAMMMSMWCGVKNMLSRVITA